LKGTINERDVEHIQLRFVDCHLHLADETYRGKIPQIIEASGRVGVIALIVNSENLETSLTTLKLSDQHPHRIYPAIGIQPWYATKVGEEEVNAISGLITQNVERLMAVGEIGLDRKYVKSADEKRLQEKIFEAMLDVAEQAHLPAIIHSGQSAVEVLNRVANRDLASVVMHWYSGPTDLIKEFTSKGYYISFGPAICYAKHIQEIAELTPLDAILTETDGPVRYRGPFSNKETTPELLPIVVQKLAELKEIEVIAMADQIIENNINAFPKLAHCLKGSVNPSEL